MKKIIIVLVIVMCMTSLGSITIAEEGVYYLPEVNMNVKPPADWLVLTRNVQEGDEALVSLQLSRDELLSQYEDFGIYLNAIQLDPLIEVLVIMQESKASRRTFDFTTLSDRKLKGIAEEMMSGDIAELVSEFEEVQGVDLGDIDDAKYSGYEFYSTDQADYIVLDMFQNYAGIAVFTTQYYTMINGQAVSITLKSYAGEVTQEYNDILREVVDSIEYTLILDKPKSFLPDFTNLVTLLQLGILIVLVFGGLSVVIKLRRDKKKASVK